MTEGFHYTDSGLDYVYLTSGYTIHKTDHGTGASIENARQLHEHLALDIVSRPYPLRGQEVRFLRAMLKVSQEGLARVLRQRRGSVARWEAEPDKDLPGAADSALRMFYALKAGAHETAAKSLMSRRTLTPRPRRPGRWTGARCDRGARCRSVGV